MLRSRTLLIGLTLSLLPGISPAGAAVSTGGGTDPQTGSGQAAGLTNEERKPDFMPAHARRDDVVSERELAVLVGRVARQFGSQTAHPMTVQHPFAPVSRLRVLAALVKLGTATVTENGAAAPEKMPADAASIPAWGRPFAAAAVEQGWWPTNWALRGQEVATWAFVEAVMSRMISSTLSEVKEASGKQAASAGLPWENCSAASDAQTGLILDARGLELQRTMGPRIVDEDGQVLYPDPNHVPSMSVLQDHGMAAYVKDAQDAPRSGPRPLVVPTVAVTGPANVDLVVSRETARRIREADGRGGFLSRWAVSILISSH